VANHNAGSNAVKSRRQHELDGTFRKDRHADLKNPEPTPGRPEPPAELDKVGQDAWDWMMWAFEDMGMLTKVDAAAVYAYCCVWSKTLAVEQQQAEMREAVRVLRENVPDIRKDDPAGLIQLFQEIVGLEKLISKCTDQSRAGWMAIRQYLVEFGLTPASRGRIKLPPKEEEKDEFAAFQLARVK
jgi:Phage terminase, small subunit